MKQPQKTLNEWLGAEDYLRDSAITQAKSPIIRKLRAEMDLSQAASDVVADCREYAECFTHQTLNQRALRGGYDLCFTIQTLELQTDTEDDNTWSAQVTISNNDTTIKVHTVAQRNPDTLAFEFRAYQLHLSIVAAQRSAFARAIQSLVDLYFDCVTFHQPNISSLLFGLIPPLKGRGFPTMALWDDIIKELEKLYGEYRFTHCHHSPV